MTTKAILLDIPGTCSPPEFFKNVLIPYAKARLAVFVGVRFADIRHLIPEIAEEYKGDFANQLYGRDLDESSPASIANYLEFLLHTKRKPRLIGEMQGLIWKRGYEMGDLTTTLYEDVPVSFKRWNEEGVSVAIFSSVGVSAQRAFFSNTDQGTVAELIQFHFDNSVGERTAPATYWSIAETDGFPAAENVLFVSSDPKEVSAATSAGMKTLLCVRNEKRPEGSIASLQEIETGRKAKDA